jgi:hypothetical protein
MFFLQASTASNPLLTIIASRLNGFVIIEMRNLEILSSSVIQLFYLVFVPFNGDYFYHTLFSLDNYILIG